MNFREQSKYPKMFKFVNKINISTWSSFAVLLKKKDVLYVSPSQRQFCACRFVCDMIGLDKTKTNWFGWERIGSVPFLTNYFLNGHVVMRRERQDRHDYKFHKDIIGLPIAVLLHFKSTCNGNFISILAPRYVLYAHILCSHCLLSIRSDSGEIFRWVLKSICYPNSMSMLSWNILWMLL